MNFKRILGLVSFCGGVIASSYALHFMKEIATAKETGHKVENFFTHNPSAWNGIIEFFGGKAQEEIAKHDMPVLALLIAGALLCLFGIIMVCISYKKRK